jgi:Ca2+/Na+ antiporter
MDKRTAEKQRRNEIGGWIFAALGAAILIRLTIFGGLNEPGSYGTGEAIGGVIALAMVAVGLYFAISRTTAA